MSHVVWAPVVEVGTVVVDGPEGRHAADVRRLRVGEHVDVVDGHGLRGRAMVAGVAKGSATLHVTALAQEPRPEPWITVVQALPKGERAELAVELCSEVGVDEVVPWQASRSITRWSGERGTKGLERWRSTAREAGKQARRARFVEVAEPVDLGALLELVAGATVAVVLEATAAVPLASLEVPTSGSLLLVVGPEGGLEPSELAALAAAGAVPVRLGPSVLRTSGAGAVAAAVLLARSGRWSGPLT